MKRFLIIVALLAGLSACAPAMRTPQDGGIGGTGAPSQIEH